MSRVVITGLGVVSSLGIGQREFSQSLLLGKSGISEVDAFTTSDHAVHVGGQVRKFDPLAYISPGRVHRYGRASQFAIASARMAISDSGLTFEARDSALAVVIGTTMAEAQAIELIDKMYLEHGSRNIPGKLFAQYPGNMIGAHVAAELGCCGPVLTFGNACAAGNYAIAYAYDLIQMGRTEMAVAGGADAFSRIAFTGFNRLLAMAPKGCQPFNRDRKGMLLGEGAGVVVLESLEAAKKRGAEIYAEIIGYGLSCDAGHMTIPSVEGVENVMANALQSSNLSCDDVDYISAHGTGTPANDRVECAAIKKTFRSRSHLMPISSIKSMLGHTMGAASALEAIACAIFIKEGFIAPTINFQEADPECEIDCVPNTARRQDVKVALNNSFAFGGNNACVVLRDISNG